MSGISGILKLRLLVTSLFFLMALSIALSWMASDIDYEAELEFYDSISDDDLDELIRIYENYPETDTLNIYSLSGWIIYAVTFMLFVLMVKVWKVEEIYNYSFSQFQNNQNYEQFQAQCPKCNYIYWFTKNDVGATNVKCPQCGVEGVVDD